VALTAANVGVEVAWPEAWTGRSNASHEMAIACGQLDRRSASAPNYRKKTPIG